MAKTNDALAALLVRAAEAAADLDGPGHPGGAVGLHHSVVMGEPSWIAVASWADSSKVFAPAEDPLDALYSLLDLLQCVQARGWTAYWTERPPLPVVPGWPERLAATR